MEETNFLYRVAINPTDGTFFETTAHVATLSTIAIGLWEVLDGKDKLSKLMSSSSAPAPRGRRIARSSAGGMR